MEDANTNTKQLSICGTSNRYKIKKAQRVENISQIKPDTIYWGLTNEELSHINQLNILNNNCDDTNPIWKLIQLNIKKKISSYKQQDKLHNIYDLSNFINLTHIIQLLKDCNLMCVYCKQNIFILYRNVRDDYQWTLDRIDNTMGHNINNTTVSCLKCNLQRRNINKESFMFSKNFICTKKT